MAGDLYVGLISGTSADGIDAALVSFDEQYPALLQSHLEPFSETTKARLFSLFTPDANQIDLMGQMDVELGALFSQATNNLLQKANIANNQVRAIGSHGQTIRHRPDTENASDRRSKLQCRAYRYRCGG
jgi:anhydro-N-acetylmuramic acid kinase